MGTTANRGYTYPAASDPPQGNAQIQELAEDIDADVAGLPILQAKKSIIAAEQTRSAAGYGYLGTEDKVTGIVLPTDGLIVVAFQGLWKESVAHAARAAIFIGSNQLEASDGQDAPLVAETTITGPNTPNTYVPLTTDTRRGLAGALTSSSTPDASEVTTGQLVGQLNTYGGPCYIFAAAGTYDVGVKFQPTSGTVTAKERKLWVWTMAFD